MMPQPDRILDLVRAHDTWRGQECINLIPSENAVSPAVREILQSDIGNRYTLPNSIVYGEVVDNAYRGTRYIDELEAIAENLAREVFGSRYACIKPISGHVANIVMLLALCRPGDTLLTLPEEIGGYPGYLPDYVPSFLGLYSLALPGRNFQIDYHACEKAIGREKPSLVVVGASIIPFPFNLKRLTEACDRVGARIGYDASHVLGIIAGRRFQKPLAEGADIVVASTHKTFFGPQGGLTLANDADIHKGVIDSLTWKTVDNAHWNRIAATAYALLEIREFGKEYADQVVRNAKPLVNS